MPFDITFDGNDALSADFEGNSAMNTQFRDAIVIHGSGAVDSVNGKTGVVVLDAEDVGALPDDTVIPSKTSDLTNDSGFITSAPVTSVNGKTGAVVLDADDVGAATEEDVLAAYPTPTVSGAMATFSDGADGLPVKALTVDFAPVQSGSGDPAPDNVMPISGWDEAKIWVQPTHDTSAEPSVVVDLGGTRYGGTLDVLTGELTVTIVGETITKDSAFTLRSGGVFQYTTSSLFRKPKYAHGISGGEFMCDRLSVMAAAGYASLGSYCFGYYNASNDIGSSTAYFAADKDTITTVALMRTWLESNPITFTYPLYYPVTVQLDPETLPTMLGVNNIWADVGDVSVTYRADPALYIENRTDAVKALIAGVEDGFTASQNYTSGDLLIVGDALYRVTASIASGETITPGTNVTATTVAAEIASGGGGSSVSPYTSNPAALGTASPGSSANYSRGDHVHDMPTAAQVGAIAAPSAPTAGQFLVYDGSAWVAQTLATWQASSY